MKATILLLAIALALGAPTRPNIPEIFESVGTVSIRERNGTLLTGTLAWAQNQPLGHGLDHVKIHVREDKGHFFLQRYDLNSSYSYLGAHGKCERHGVSGEMPKAWEWVAESEYKGKIVVQGRSLDLWEFARGHAVVSVGVLETNPNAPFWTRRVSNERDFNVTFQHFTAKPPKSDLFNVPEQCKHAIPRRHAKRQGCVNRSDMMSNGQVWVDNQVPYDQQGTYQGYREDCSGFVSMCWELSTPGLTTSTLSSVASPTDQSSLQPGDILLDASEHVVLFGGWTDSSMTQYTALEETRPGEGTVERTTPYPYWYNQAAFLPYTYNNVC